MPVEREGSQLDGVGNKSGTSAMDDPILRRLNAIGRSNASAAWINKDLYRLMYRSTLYVSAYERIKSKPGNMTPGVDGTTLDGFSMTTIENIAKGMRDESFQFSRARRVKIPKASGGTRPLGIAPPRDKIVQEAMRIILEAIYDSPFGPTFLGCSHGFRPGRSPHTALRTIRTEWSGVTWIIEGDIKGCFDNIDHETLIGILRKRISDERFLNLIRKSISAGYLEYRTPIGSIIGTPQGSILSPILANIYMHELDMFVQRIVAREEREAKRVYSRRYADLMNELKRIRRRLDKAVGDERAQLLTDLDRAKTEQRATRPFTAESAGIQVKYVRYADDWIIGVNGSKELAVKIKSEIANFLITDLKLTLSQEKTHIRHAKTEEAFFLGTSLRIGTDSPRTTTIRRIGVPITKRTGGWTPRMFAPVGRIVKRLHERGMCDADGKPSHVNSWIMLDDTQIVEAYNLVLQGYMNYYCFVDNMSMMSRVQYIIQHSAAKTLAAKHKSSIRKVFRKYGRTLSVSSVGDDRTVTKRLKFRDSLVATPKEFLLGKGWQGSDGVVQTTISIRTSTRLSDHCALCGSDGRIEMHHVRHIRKQGEKLDWFTRAMASLNRKQIPVCTPCHTDIHAGRYDGAALSTIVAQVRGTRIQPISGGEPASLETCTPGSGGGH